MTGDQADILVRLKSVLPSRWFSDVTPVLDALLSSLSVTWTQIYSLLNYTRAQSRIATATSFWLDMIADDCLGPLFTRRTNEADPAFRERITKELVRERCTRFAVAGVLSDLTGVPPQIFEPANCADTGSYSVGFPVAGTIGGGMAYGTTGGWGSLALPFTSFLRVQLPMGTGAGQLPGWDTGNAGYGSGFMAYASISTRNGQVTDADVSQALANVLPTAVTAWLQVSN
jgi:hypothetical protein